MEILLSKIKNVSIVRLELPIKNFHYTDLRRLRAFLRTQMPDTPEIDNHLEDNQFRYVYPEIQYKIIDHKPTILAHSQGKDIVTNIFMKIDQVKLGERTVDITNRTVSIYEDKIGTSDQKLEYKFIHPWMALNQKNFKKLHSTPVKQWNQFLSRILRGNLMSLSRGFDYWIPDLDELEIEGSFDPRTKNMKGNQMEVFYGHFTVNFYIPEFMGIGKQVALGHGTVTKTSGTA